jgi:hypothetical protein
MIYWRLPRLETVTKKHVTKETVTMNKSTILSVGNNRKLAKHVGVLSLPEGETCPGATALCKRVCYGIKASKMYKAVRPKRQGNLALSRTKEFPEALAAEIRALGLQQVRLHEAGDVYNQAYLDKLYQVCRELPAVRFLMYTKSFHLDWSGKPDNLALYWSVDKTTTAKVPPGPRAYLVARGDMPPVPPRAPGKPALTCVHTAAKHYCGGECQICWTGTQDVYFPQH